MNRHVLRARHSLAEEERERENDVLGGGRSKVTENERTYFVSVSRFNFWKSRNGPVFGQREKDEQIVEYVFGTSDSVNAYRKTQRRRFDHCVFVGRVNTAKFQNNSQF